MICIGCRDPQSPVAGESTKATTQLNPKSDKTEVPAASPKQSTDFSFVDMAKQRNCKFAYRNGEELGFCAMIENLGGGVALFDYDADGDLDIGLPGGGDIPSEGKIVGLPTGLFRSQPDAIESVADKARIQQSDIYTHGAAVLDYDNDGFDDLLITGFGGVRLYRNCGDGTFLAIATSVLSGLDGWFTSAAAGDFNADGMLDLYLCRYVNWSWDNNPLCFTPDRSRRELCSPLDFKGIDDVLLMSGGDGTWIDQSVAAGLTGEGKGLGVIVCDMDGDHDCDVYVANDTTENFLYLNDGTGKFLECGMLRGAAVDDRALPNGSMGLSVCDINRDLLTDIWVTNFEREVFAIYRNEGDAYFLHTSRRYGINALGGKYVGFGTDWQDFDLDGINEFVVTNGHVLKYPVATPRRQSPLLLHEAGSRYERTIPDGGYFNGDYEGRGLATGDMNQDGLRDIVISHINQNVAILHNNSAPRGPRLRLTLIGRHSNRNAIGASVVLTTSAGKRLNHVVGGGSYLSHGERSLDYGFKSDEKPQSIAIKWPSGRSQSIPINTFEEHRLVEPN
jgi:enediyne biosynthesis protein E4